MVQKKQSTDLSKFVRRTRGKYLVATMPERFGPFITEELVAEIRRRQPAATLEQIAGDFGESFVNFWRYRKGKPVPLGKARRFVRRLRELHLGALERLERLSQSHPRGHEVADFTRNASRAYDEGYRVLTAALGECEEIVRAERAALVLKRTQRDAQVMALAWERTRSRSDRLMLEVARSRNLSLTEWPPPRELAGYWVYRVDSCEPLLIRPAQLRSAQVLAEFAEAPSPDPPRSRP